MPSPRRPGLHAAALRPARPGWDVPARASRRPHEDPAARLRPVSVDPRESSTCLKAGGDDELRPRRPASVCSRTPGASPGPGAGPARGCAPAGSAPRPRLAADFASGVPDLASAPREDWAWAVHEASRTAPNAEFGYGDPAGNPRLREILAAYLRRVRAADTAAGQLIICSGMTQGL